MVIEQSNLFSVRTIVSALTFIQWLRLLFLVQFLLLFPSNSLGQTSVTTQRYDNARTGQNLSETALNTTNVAPATFGKLFTRAVDDEVYAQPLYMPNVPVPTVGARNVLYVTTVNNSVYAFDADNPSAAAPLAGRPHPAGTKCKTSQGIRCGEGLRHSLP